MHIHTGCHTRGHVRLLLLFFSPLCHQLWIFICIFFIFFFSLLALFMKQQSMPSFKKWVCKFTGSRTIRTRDFQTESPRCWLLYHCRSDSRMLALLSNHLFIVDQPAIVLGGHAGPRFFLWLLSRSIHPSVHVISLIVRLAHFRRLSPFSFSGWTPIRLTWSLCFPLSFARFLWLLDLFRIRLFVSACRTGRREDNVTCSF